MNNNQSAKHHISNSQIYKCIILAAGVSSRLRPLTNEKPKCLLEVSGITLLQRTIDNILVAGINEIAIVVGYKAEMIREFVKNKYPKLKIRFILNPNYASTNNAYSLLLAKNFIEDNFNYKNTNLLLLDSDILFPSELLKYLRLNTAPDKIAVCVEGERNEEEMRVVTDEHGYISMFSKKIPLGLTYGESIGIEIFSGNTTEKLFNILEKRIQKKGGGTEFYEASFQEMIDNGVKLKAVDISQFQVIEIDTIEDLELARRMKVD